VLLVPLVVQQIQLPLGGWKKNQSSCLSTLTPKLNTILCEEECLSDIDDDENFDDAFTEFNHGNDMKDQVPSPPLDTDTESKTEMISLFCNVQQSNHTQKGVAAGEINLDADLRTNIQDVSIKKEKKSKRLKIDSFCLGDSDSSSSSSSYSRNEDK